MNRILIIVIIIGITIDGFGHGKKRSIAKTMSALEAGTVSKIPEININSKSGVSLTFENDTVTFGNAECKNCTLYVQKQMENLQNLFRSRKGTSAMTVGGIPGCYNCKFVNAEDVDNYGDACPTPKSDDPNFSYTTFNLMWKNISVECDCGLSLTTLNPISALQNQFQNGLGTCPENGDLEVNVGSTYQGLFDEILKPNFTKTTSCVKLPQSLNLGNFNYSIFLNWENTAARITLQVDKRVKGPQSLSIVGVRIINRNYSNIQAHCHSQNTALNFCECIIDSGAAITVMQQSMETLVSCSMKSNDIDLKLTLLSYIFCD